ncbi:amino acid--tRNA ligase-related protein [Actinoalloteichus sp. GBA129-24]|uniref:amino acid--tRNA ligase-related protein n=1 Tax=Actinoalloteichus sp. GBA129-24 TaxID=1612551 RepID=UPI0018DC4AE8|nr:amino acid--tRNA ligase-related protein [Actinoalloteichus sp. GBA129-24]
MTPNSDYTLVAQQIATVHAAAQPTTWDAPRELLRAATALFTTGEPPSGVDNLLAGLAQLLAQGPFTAVGLHAAIPSAPLPPSLRPARPTGPPEEDVLRHALALAESPSTLPWPNGPADPVRLTAALRALGGRIPCRMVAMRTVAVAYLLEQFSTASEDERRWRSRRIAWLLDPRVSDIETLLLELTGPGDPLVAPVRTSTRRWSEPVSDRPLPLSGWSHQQAVDGVLCLAGRIGSVRGHRRLVFADLWWEGACVQLALEGEHTTRVRAGDLVSIRGTGGRSRTGHPTVFVTHLDRHCPGAIPAQPPAVGISSTVTAIRRYLGTQGFAEMITPVLSDGYFGGAARPFTTWAAAAERRQYLRVTTELALLEVIASGRSRCYEIGPSFRNEGLRGQSAKEFLMFEAYSADLDRDGMVDCMLELIRTVAAYPAPVRRMSFDEAFLEVCGVDPQDVVALSALAAEHIPITASRTGDPDILARRLWRTALRARLPGLVALDAIPGPASPLIAGTGRAAARVWLYAQGVELAEISRNECDPRKLAEAFRHQFASDPHAVHRDCRQVVALFEGGVPPCVGVGMSISRLAQLTRDTAPKLTDSPYQQELTR